MSNQLCWEKYIKLSTYSMHTSQVSSCFTHFNVEFLHIRPLILVKIIHKTTAFFAVYWPSRGWCMYLCVCVCVNTPFIKRFVCEAPLVRPWGRFSLDYKRLAQLHQWLHSPARRKPPSWRRVRKTKRGREKLWGERGRKHQGLPVPPGQYENAKSIRISSWAQ